MTTFGDIRSLIHAAPKPSQIDREALIGLLHRYEGDPQQVISYLASLPVEAWPVVWQSQEEASLKLLGLLSLMPEDTDLCAYYQIGDHIHEVWSTSDALRPLTELSLVFKRHMWTFAYTGTAHNMEPAKTLLWAMLAKQHDYAVGRASWGDVLDMSAHIDRRPWGSFEDLPAQVYNRAFEAGWVLYRELDPRYAHSDAIDYAKEHDIKDAAWLDPRYLELGLLRKVQ